MQAWCKCQDIQSRHEPFVSLDPVLALRAEQQHTLTCSTSGLRARSTGVWYPNPQPHPPPVPEPRNSHLASMHRHPCTAVVWHASDLEPHCQCNTGTLERLTTPAAGMEHSNRIAAVVHRCKDIGIRWPPRHFCSLILHRFCACGGACVRVSNRRCCNAPQRQYRCGAGNWILPVERPTAFAPCAAP